MMATRTGDSRVNPPPARFGPAAGCHLQPPADPRRFLSARLAGGGAVAGLRIRAQRQGQSRRAKNRQRLRLPRQYGGLRHQPVAHSVQRIGHLRPRLLRRPSQHAAGRCDRYRARDHPRLPRRPRAAVAQLARCAARGGVCRADPQPAALVPAPVLVSRRAGHAAGTAPKHLAVRRDLPQQPRHHRARAGGGGGDRRGHRRLRLERDRDDCAETLGQAPPDAHRPAVSAVVDRPRARRHGISDPFRQPRASRLQLCRRSSAAARIHRTSGCADHLYRGLHRRGRACRRACRPARTDRGGVRAWAAARLGAAPHRRAAGATRDRAAAHQSVSQPHEEFLARGRRRLSRPVRGVRRHRPAPDRPSDRDHRHHHGGLPRHFAHHQRADELVQRPHPGGGTLMAADAQPSYIRRAVVEPEPPPAAAAAPARTRLFDGPFNTALTLLSIVIVAALAWPTVKFLFIDAVWTGSSRLDCLSDTVGREVGACWPFIKAKFTQLMYGFYPASQQWRVDVTYALGAILLVPLLIPGVPWKGLNAILFFGVFPLVAFFLLVGGVFGLPHVETRVWGGLLVTLVISFTGIIFSLPLGILLALA